MNAQIDSVARRKPEADRFHLSRMKTHVAFTERCLDELASWDRNFSLLAARSDNHPI